MERGLGLVYTKLLRLIQRQRDEFFELGTAERFAFRDCSHDRLRHPDRGWAAEVTLAGGRDKAQQKREKKRLPGAAETRRGTDSAAGGRSAGDPREGALLGRRRLGRHLHR